MFHTVPKVSQVRNPTSKQTENVRRDFARVRLISVMILLTYITDVILLSLSRTDRLSALLSKCSLVRSLVSFCRCIRVSFCLCNHLSCLVFSLLLSPFP